jgi:hypothetical protein
MALCFVQGVLGRGHLAYSVGILVELISELQRQLFKKSNANERHIVMDYSRSQPISTTEHIHCGVVALRWQPESGHGASLHSYFSSMIL